MFWVPVAWDLFHHGTSLPHVHRMPNDPTHALSTLHDMPSVGHRCPQGSPIPSQLCTSNRLHLWIHRYSLLRCTPSLHIPGLNPVPVSGTSNLNACFPASAALIDVFSEINGLGSVKANIGQELFFNYFLVTVDWGGVWISNQGRLCFRGSESVWVDDLITSFKGSWAWQFCPEYVRSVDEYTGGNFSINFRWLVLCRVQ